MPKNALKNPTDSKRQLGVYYTPLELSEIVCAWAVRTAEDKVLEPSFGGCVFLRAASAALQEKGAKNPEDNVFGCDVDKAAFFHLAASFPKGFPEDNFEKLDFLKLTNRHFRESKFEAVIGNPPYVSYHNMTTGQRRAVHGLKELVIPVQSKASLWAYFVAHSISFLKIGGRMGWILPGSLVHAEYGKDLLKRIGDQFRQTTAIKLQQRCFGHVGTDEATVVLLCEDYQPNLGSGRTNTTHVEDLTACAQLVKSLSASDIPQEQHAAAVANPFNMEIGDVHSEIQGTLGIRRLGEIAEVKIGVVTGANRFFLISEKRAVELKLPAQALTPFLTRFYQAPGINLTQKDLIAAKQAGENCLLIDTREVEHSQEIQRYLRTFDKTEREENETFKKYEKWHQPQMGIISDAFLSYMHDEGPRLVFNQAGVYCTNSIHRIYFKAGSSEAQRLALALSVTSTLGQFCAEVEGRSYGSGVLKIEPSEARQILIACPRELSLSRLRMAVREIDVLLRNGENMKARILADSYVFELVPALSRRVSQKRLRELLTVLRKRRSPRLKLALHKGDAVKADVSLPSTFS